MQLSIDVTKSNTLVWIEFLRFLYYNENKSKLAVRAELFDLMSEEQQDFLDQLNPLNIEARYPEYIDEIADRLTKEDCEELIMGTEELLCWIKKQLQIQLNGM
jgi:HEPN domain-containing protein